MARIGLKIPICSGAESAFRLPSRFLEGSHRIENGENSITNAHGNSSGESALLLLIMEWECEVLLDSLFRIYELLLFAGPAAEVTRAVSSHTTALVDEI